MKRGLIHWDLEELPRAELAARLVSVHTVMRAYGIDALVMYADVWRCNDVRYLSNYMPYWNRALAVVPQGEEPVLLCSLSPRVYPWIRSVTVHETILASPQLPVALFKLCTERKWRAVGVCDLEGLPYDLYTQLLTDQIEVIDIPRSAIRPAPTEVEVTLHAHAAHLARAALVAEMPTVESIHAEPLSDHQLVGRLEHRVRRAGAEDAVILLANGRGPPVPAHGASVGVFTSVAVAVERNGHWAKVTRNVAGVVASLLSPADGTVSREILSGPYSWQSTDNETRAAVVSLHRQINTVGRRLYYGDTCLQKAEGLRLL
jgi:hypothetical protein